MSSGFHEHFNWWHKSVTPLFIEMVGLNWFMDIKFRISNMIFSYLLPNRRTPRGKYKSSGVWRASVRRWKSVALWLCAPGWKRSRSLLTWSMCCRGAWVTRGAAAACADSRSTSSAPTRETWSLTTYSTNNQRTQTDMLSILKHSAETWSLDICCWRRMPTLRRLKG